MFFMKFDFPDYGGNAFQGCWNEDPLNADLPIVLQTDSSTKPSDCLEACRGRNYKALSVQTVR